MLLISFKSFQQFKNNALLFKSHIKDSNILNRVIVTNINSHVQTVSLNVLWSVIGFIATYSNKPVYLVEYITYLYIDNLNIYSLN